jgi:pimeloyl-ACP methyl ester carboxylesterase
MVLRAGIAARFGRLAGLIGAAWIAAIVPAAAATSAAHVYLLRGLLNMSPGFDTLAATLHSHGVPATLDSYGSWSALARDAIADYKHGRLRSIVIIGHSSGGGAALDMAATLGRAGVPVDLVVAIDPTGTTSVPANVRHTINLYVAGGVGSPLTGAAKARGAIQNLPDRAPNVGHFSIIAAHERQVLGYVLSATRSRAALAPAANNAAAN